VEGGVEEADATELLERICQADGIDALCVPALPTPNLPERSWPTTR
jgi:hypothetical protein